MDKQLQNEIINYKNPKLKYINYRPSDFTTEDFIRRRKTIDRKNKKRYNWYKYNLKYVKRYNKTCATNMGLGKEQLLSKDDLLIWCEINGIKCAKSKKYCDIVKLLIQKI